MKPKIIIRKQNGFFTFGLGLGLMILFGGTAAMISAKTDDQSRLASKDSVVKYESLQKITGKSK